MHSGTLSNNPHEDPALRRLSRICWVLIALALLVQCGQAASDEPCQESMFVSADAWSKHLIGGDFNEHHEAIGLECNQWSMLYFKNSHYKAGRVGSEARHDKRSIGLGRNIKWRQFGPVHVDGYLAAWTGYYDQGVTNAGIIPVAAPRISANFHGVELAILPTPYVVVFQVGYRFR